MSTMTFVNLPVKDLAATRTFFDGLGFGFNEMFSDDQTACLVISDLAFVMLHTEPKFAGFSEQPAVDTARAREVLVGLSADSREEVDRLADTAATSGGQAVGGPQDQDGMYMRAFLDPDGHQWSAIYLDLSAVPEG